MLIQLSRIHHARLPQDGSANLQDCLKTKRDVHYPQCHRVTVVQISAIVMHLAILKHSCRSLAIKHKVIVVQTPFMPCIQIAAALCPLKIEQKSYGIGRFQAIKTDVLLIFSFISGDKTEFLSPMMFSNKYITGI